MARELPRPQGPMVIEALPEGARIVTRSVHPWAWWVWAIGGAIAASMTTNPLLLTLITFAMITVIFLKRSDAPWARAVWIYFVMAAMILAIRMFFRVFFGGGIDGTVLFTLPEIPLPEWAAGIRIGGAVTLEGVLYTLYDSMRISTLIICIGAAVCLANPKKALKNVPAAFAEISTAIVIALSVAPQVVESIQRVRKARRLRGGVQKGVRGVVSIMVPVLEDSVERSLSLAAGMESRGYGATKDDTRVSRFTFLIMVFGMMCFLVGVFLILAASDALKTALVFFITGLTLTVIGLRSSSKRLQVTHYRPDPWGLLEYAVSLCGLLAVGIAVWQSQVAPYSMNLPFSPPRWPDLSMPLILIAVVLVAPAFFVPEPVHIAHARFAAKMAKENLDSPGDLDQTAFANPVFTDPNLTDPDFADSAYEKPVFGGHVGAEETEISKQSLKAGITR